MVRPSLAAPILVLDPTPAVLDGLVQGLLAMGHRVVRVETAAQAIGSLQSEGGRLILARAAGAPKAVLGLLAALRQRTPLPLILLAGPADGPAERRAALEFGADDVWPAGIDDAEMLGRLLALLRRLPMAGLGERAGSPAPRRLDRPVPAGAPFALPATEPRVAALAEPDQDEWPEPPRKPH